MLTVDKKENGIITIDDDGECFEINASQTDGAIREGDVVVCVNGIYRRDEAATEKRRKEIIRLQDSLWN